MEKSNENNDKEMLNWFQELEEPLNPTDPYVVIDPETSKAGIVVGYSGSETANTDQEKTKYDAIKVPLINLNGINLTEDKIESMTIIYNDFAPKLKLIINDPKRDTQYIGGPGLHNAVTVIITCPTSGMYKKITLVFYIKEIKNLSESLIEYDCEYHNSNLNKIAFGQFGDSPLTTFQFCEEVAKTLKIGFAATEKCKEISDAKWRQAYSQRMKDFIVDQVNCGGLDETSVFDCWIDLFGYLILVNFSYVMKEKVSLNNFSILTHSGAKPTFQTSEETNKPLEVKRMISNNESLPFKQLQIEKTQNNLFTKNTQNTGAFNTFWILNSAGDQNLLEKKQIQMIEDSVEGITMAHTYESQNTEFLGAEMAEDTPCLFQQHVRKMYFLKYRSRQLTVELKEANYGIQRGTLIYVSITESDNDKKQMINVNGTGITSSNLVSAFKQMSGGDSEDADITPTTDEEPLKMKDLSMQESTISNPALSGFYYVDSMIFTYKSGSENLTQTLNLIKKDLQTSMLNTVNSINIPKSTLDEHEEQ